MPSKSEKIIRKIASDVRLGNGLPIFWHLGRANFGDDINPWFYRHLAGGAPNFWQRTSRDHVLGVGSIAEKMTAHSRVAGSGFIRPILRAQVTQPHSCFSLRGELSAEILGVHPLYYGDPISLINLLIPVDNPSQASLLGVVPHVNELGNPAWKLLEGRPDVVLIDVRNDPVEVVRKIASCARIASQSLHGLVVADAYEVPNVWIGPAKSMLGADFKFLDYFTSLDRSKNKIGVVDFLQNMESVEYSYGKLKAKKDCYLADLADYIRNQCASIGVGRWRISK